MGLRIVGWAGAVTFVSALWFLACSSDSKSSKCEEGEEGCACYPNDTCNGELQCHSETCVSLSGGSGGSGGSGNGGSSGDDGDGTDSGGSGGGSTGGGSSTDSGSSTGGGSSTDSGGSGGAGTTSPSSSTTSGNPPSDSPVVVHGQLTLQGQQLVDASGKAVQLKGVSSMWLNWDPTGYAESLEGLRWMRDNWGLTIIRAAMGVDADPPDDTYLDNPEKAKGQVKTIIENAIAAGVYVLVDWHDHEADLHQDEAEAFFHEISSEYGDHPNVLYELYNEPLDVSWADVVKPYHEAVSSVIRANDSDNVIILGTPNWSQDVDVAAQSPVAGTNLMYTLHFYACSHGAELRAKAAAAYDAGLPLFVTEWGASDADGGVDGIVCEADAQAWHDWLDPRGISWAAWKLDGCTDSTCFFKDRTAPVDGGWDDSHLNGHAPYVIERMLADNPYLDDDVDPTECEPSGTCANDDGVDCSPDDEPVERDCSSCELLSCGVSCCASIDSLGAHEYPFLERPELITSFTPGATEANVQATFDGPGQMAAITFKLTEARTVDPYLVTVTLDASGDSVVTASDVTVSLENGVAGCEYPIVLSGQTATLNYLYPVCWEDFTTYSPVSQINVRLLSYTAGSASLSVYGVSF